MPGGGRRSFVVSADAVDPGVNVIGVDVKTRGKRSLGRGYAFGFRGEAVPAFRLGICQGAGGHCCDGIDHLREIARDRYERQADAMGDGVDY